MIREHGGFYAAESANVGYISGGNRQPILEIRASLKLVNYQRDDTPWNTFL